MPINPRLPEKYITEAKFMNEICHDEVTWYTYIRSYSADEHMGLFFQMQSNLMGGCSALVHLANAGASIEFNDEGVGDDDCYVRITFDSIYALMSKSDSEVRGLGIALKSGIL